MTNVEIITTMYSHFSTGNVPAVLGSFHPDIEWRECAGMPTVQNDGIYRGPEEILQGVFMPLMTMIDGFNIAVNEIFGTGDKVVMAGYYQGTNKATGNHFKAQAAHIWTLKDEKITHFFHAVDTALINR